MKRVVVTGIGIVSSLGNNCREVLASLRLKSGIEFEPVFQQMGMRSQVAGTIKLDPKKSSTAKSFRFMGNAAMLLYIALQKPSKWQACLKNKSPTRAPASWPVAAAPHSSGSSRSSRYTLRESGVKDASAYGVTKTMSSTVSACLATSFKVKGVNYSISSACSTSAHCIGHASELIQMGKQRHRVCRRRRRNLLGKWLRCLMRWCDVEQI